MHLDMKTAETILTARLGNIPDAADIAWAASFLPAADADAQAHWAPVLADAVTAWVASRAAL